VRRRHAFAAFAIGAVVAPGVARARPTLAGEATFGVPSGGALVHYATTGVDAVPAADADGDGTPDFVEEVAEVAEEALARYAADGFRAPLTDGAIADNGGDARVDVYLQDLDAADGNASTDACTGGTCIGHAITENDYAGFGYPSRGEGIRSVVPHEIFHLVQYAYDDDQLAVWSEGSAVWATEHLYGGANADFERFLPGFLARTYRPLERGGGGFGDPYVYGAALWPYFLGVTHGAAAIGDAWTACAGATPFLDAIDAALGPRGATVEAAFTAFTRANLFTGARAAGGPYADLGAGEWIEVPREPALDPAAGGTVQLEGLAARYVPIALAAGAWRVTATPAAGRRIAAWIVADDGALAEGAELVAEDGGALAVVVGAGAARAQTLVVTGLSPNTITSGVALAVAPAPDDPDAGGGGCAAGHGAGGPFALGLLVLLLARGREHRRAVRALAGVVVASAIVVSAQAQPADTGEPPTVGLTDEELAAAAAADEIIVVTGTRSERPASSATAPGEVVTRADLDRTGARTVADALATRPGVWVERTLGRAAVSLSGLGPEYTLVLVDGRRQVGRVDGVLDLDRISAGGVERIEVLRGAGSALYGSDALGGIVNVISADPDERFAQVGVRTDSIRSTDVDARAGDGRRALRWQLGGGLATGDGYDRDPSDLSTTASEFTEARTDGRIAWAPGDGKRVSLGANYTRRDLRGVNATGSGAVFDNRNLDEEGMLRLDARWALASGTIVRGGVAASELRDQFLSDQRRSDALDTYQESIDRALEGSAQIERRFGARNLVTAGVDGLVEALSSPRLDDGDGSRARAAVFLQDELRLGAADQLLIVPAARLDADTQFGVHATPRLAARWDVDERVAVRASYGWGYRAPDFKQLYLRFENPGVGYVVEGDPDLAPETSQTVAAGGELRVAGATFSVDVYRTDLTDMIGFVLDDAAVMPQRFVYANVAAAHVTAADAGVAWRRGRFAVRGSYSLALTRDEDRDRPLDGRPRHRGSAELAWEDAGEGFTAVARAVVTGRRSYFADMDGDGVDEERVADRYAVVGAQLAKRFGRTLHAYLGVDNALDAGDAELTPIAPRSLYAGVQVRR
jgi:outer membrane receptor for ferrienterochelin and colicins